MNAALSKRLRLLASTVSVLALLAVLALGWVYSRIRASLPQLDGRSAIAGLTAEVAIARDGLGVPTLKAQSRDDLARALGFLHAQDRFFQMDVYRRSAAGELSEVFGVKTLPHDRSMRIHGFRRTAQAALAQLPPEHRRLLEAYTEGVNAGLRALREKPFEYLVVRAEPQPWKPEDTFLVCDAMLVDLQDENAEYEKTLMTLRDQMGATGLAFFAPLQTPDDAALDGSQGITAPIPGPQTINLRRKTSLAPRPPRSPAPAPLGAFSFLEPQPDARPGSNAFALAGAHTRNGAALVAGDMHLNLRVPNVWYRASLEYPAHKITGVTLPGVPLIVAGSNGRVAWSFTNAYVDTGDLIIVETNAVADTLYRAPAQTELLTIERRKETIKVHGQKDDLLEVPWTIWGPIIGKNENGKPLAYRWTGHDPETQNLVLAEMEDAQNIDAAIDVAHRSGMPAQNIVIADSSGNIAWTIAGKLPRRAGYEGRTPVTFLYGDRSWQGLVPDADIPVVTSSPRGRPVELAAADGRIWTANQRILGGAALKTLGDGGYGRPNRAGQIREDLAGLEKATPKDLLAVQLDDRARFMERWNKLLLATLTPEVAGQKTTRAKLRGYAEKWEGRASIDAVSYPIARLFRIAVYSRVFGPIFATCREANPEFNWTQLLLEPAVWSLLEHKPMHLLDPQYASWDALLAASVDDVILELDRAGVRLPHATWGQRNTAEIRHPFSYTLPWFVRSWLDMPADPLPGDNDMPRVQNPTHGASERFVVAPGHEDEGIFHMPCGQSGHPLSPYYRAGHEAWVKGEPTPFLPGKTEHTLTLAPK